MRRHALTALFTSLFLMSCLDCIICHEPGSNAVGWPISTSKSYAALDNLFTGFVDARSHGADPTGSADSTAAIQAAIDSAYPSGTVLLPRGVYKITSTLTIDGSRGSVDILGTTGMRNVLAGGARLNSASILRWAGSENGVMLKIDSAHGVKVEKLAFQTDSRRELVMEIDNVVGVQFINKTSNRYNSIVECEFERLATGIEFFDDHGNPLSDANMDGHEIRLCNFRTYRTAIKVDQTNVYNLDISLCSFYGSTVYTKNHIWIKKGHASSTTCYFGPLKDASSVGGRDGVSIRIEYGYVHLNDPYSEAHNGPFLDWEGRHPEQSTIVLNGPLLLGSTSLNPQSYSIRNRTGGTIVIVGGHVGQSVRQDKHTLGTITLIGVNAIPADSTGNADRVVYYGNTNKSEMLGQIGTAGSGMASVKGTSPSINLFDTKGGTWAQINYDGAAFSVAKPGYVNGVRHVFATSHLDLNTHDWTISGSRYQHGSVTLSTDHPVTVVANAKILSTHKVFLFPVSAAAANLVNSIQAPYISAVTEGKGFSISTADGTHPPGGCMFNWLIL